MIPAVFSKITVRKLFSLLRDLKRPVSYVKDWTSGFYMDLDVPSRDMISVSVDLWLTEVCFLYVQSIDTQVKIPEYTKYAPTVYFDSVKQSANVNVSRQILSAF